MEFRRRNVYLNFFKRFLKEYMIYDKVMAGIKKTSDDEFSGSVDRYFEELSAYDWLQCAVDFNTTPFWGEEVNYFHKFQWARCNREWSRWANRALDKIQRDTNRKYGTR